MRLGCTFLITLCCNTTGLHHATTMHAAQLQLRVLHDPSLSTSSKWPLCTWMDITPALSRACCAALSATTPCWFANVLCCSQVRKLDFLVWFISLCSTMFLGVKVGLAVSIGLALLIVVYESAFPHTALLGRVGATTIWRNVEQFPAAQVC